MARKKRPGVQQQISIQTPGGLHSYFNSTCQTDETHTNFFKSAIQSAINTNKKHRLASHIQNTLSANF